MDYWSWTHFTSIVQALAWPATLLVIVLVFRDEVSEVVRALKSIKFGGASAEFERQAQAIAISTKEVEEAKAVLKADATIKEADDTVQSSATTSSPKIEPESAHLGFKGYAPTVSQTNLGDDGLYRAITNQLNHGQIKGSAAIVQMWNQLEFLLRQLLDASGSKIEGSPINAMSGVLETFDRRKVLAPVVLRTLYEMVMLRNGVAAASTEPSPHVVRQFAESAEVMHRELVGGIKAYRLLQPKGGATP